MAKRRRIGSLAQLEKRLSALNAERQKVIVNMRAVLAGLTAGASYLIEAERKELAPVRTAASRATRRFSKAARAKLAAAAKARWAAAKRAGKTRLG